MLAWVVSFRLHPRQTTPDQLAPAGPSPRGTFSTVFRIFFLSDYPMRIVVLSDRSESKDLSPLFSMCYALFRFPYALTPLFPTLTKNAGVYTLSSHSGT